MNANASIFPKSEQVVRLLALVASARRGRRRLRDAPN